MQGTIQDKLKLRKGQWLSINCGSMPESKCHVVMLAPASEKGELVDTAVAHAIKHHGHKDTPEFRKNISNALGSLTV